MALSLLGAAAGYRTPLRVAKVTFTVLWVLLHLSPACFGQTAGDSEKNQIKLPDQISLVVPKADVPREIASFSGMWAGDGWNGLIPAALIVENIEASGKTDVILAWGDLPARKILRGWRRLSAQLGASGMAFTMPNYGTVDFMIGADGRLFGRFTLEGGGREYIMLRKIESTRPEDVIEASQSMLGWEILQFPSAQPGSHAAQLKAVLYRSPLEGRRPVIIFCADSPISEDARARQTLAPATARIMLSAGYSVVVLQRKGVGGSEGSFMEPRDSSISEREQLNSALEDLEGAVNFVTTQPYVDPSRIVIAGIYRGGLLSVAYAAKDQRIAGAINIFGYWGIRRNWLQRLLVWRDFNADEFAAAGKKTKLPMLWLYSGVRDDAIDYARNTFRGFNYQGGQGTFVDVLAENPSGSKIVSQAKVEEAMLRYLDQLN